MKIKSLPCLFIVFAWSCTQESPKNKIRFDDADQIRTILMQQQDAWNNGDIEEFMQAYWKSDSLKFYGASGLTYGWQNTLDNYYRRYPTREAMGQLTFGIKSMDPLGTNSYALMGTFYLKREIEDLSGYYTLLWKRIDGEWLIIADMTCAN